ncbi:MAG: SulP family inorganic anion transporter, partial [Gemmatimonadota bacterium]|nr:SulP family inorganic anion transporter [Gemmatimonadota bacterium]
WDQIFHLIIPAFVIALVGFAEPAAIARTYAVQDRSKWDPNKEFVSQGMANIASGLFAGFPVGGSFSRTSVNRISGGKTRWSGAITGFTVLAFLPFASVLSTLPRAVLAAIVISAVTKLIDFKSLSKMFAHSRPQGLIGIGTFFATIGLAPRVDIAVLLGVGAAVVVHLWRELHIHIETKIQDTTLTIKPMGVLFFASAPTVEETLIEILASSPDVTTVVIDLARLGRIDFTAAMVLDQILNDAEKTGLTVSVEGVPPQARRILSRIMPSRVSAN